MGWNITGIAVGAGNTCNRHDIGYCDDYEYKGSFRNINRDNLYLVDL